MAAARSTETTTHDADKFSLSSPTDSGISVILDAGTYTIEATTYDGSVTGAFALSVQGTLRLCRAAWRVDNGRVAAVNLDGRMRFNAP